MNKDTLTAQIAKLDYVLEALENQEATLFEKLEECTSQLKFIYNCKILLTKEYEAELASQRRAEWRVVRGTEQFPDTQ